MEKQNKIVICKVCGLTNEETKFQQKKTCIKCNSKINNEKYGKLYFREFSKSKYIPTGQKKGRPREEIIENNLIVSSL